MKTLNRKDSQMVSTAVKHVVIWKKASWLKHLSPRYHHLCHVLSHLDFVTNAFQLVLINLISVIVYKIKHYDAEMENAIFHLIPISDKRTKGLI